MVVFNHIFAATLTFLFAAGAVKGQRTECKQTSVSDVDILFLLDHSNSMGPYIEEVRKGLGTFARNMEALKINGRFAVAKFGGRPALIQPFNSNATVTALAIESIKAHGVGQEASFEAIRAALRDNAGAHFAKECVAGSGPCELTWSKTARKLIVLATDEDSDLPTMLDYRVAGQSEANSLCANGDVSCDNVERFEPSFLNTIVHAGKIHRMSTRDLNLTAAYQAELDLTAKTILDQNITLMALIRDDRNGNQYSPSGYLNLNSRYYKEVNSAITDNLFTTLVQFGLPSAASQTSTFANFNPLITLQNLRNSRLSNSLQAKILAGNGFARLFSIQSFPSTLNNNGASEVTNYFYNATLQTVQNCTYYDACNIPNGDNSTCTGCDGVVNSGKKIDGCGVCGGTNSTCCAINGIYKQENQFDKCQVCNGNNACLDCEGTVNGSKKYDLCGVCGGRNNTCLDCKGNINGTLSWDLCGVCGGNSDTCLDCEGKVNGTAKVDRCGKCGGNNACLQTYTLTGTNPSETYNGDDGDYPSVTSISYKTPSNTGTSSSTSSSTSTSSDDNTLPIAIGSGVAGAVMLMVAAGGYLMSRKRKPRADNSSIGSLDSNDNDHFQSNPMFQGNNRTFENPAYKHKSGSTPSTVLA